jgi:hypothetical protein
MMRRVKQQWTVAEKVHQLDQAWKGSGWIPDDVRNSRTRPKADLPPQTIRNLLAITLHAQEQNIPLDSLWAPGGILRTALARHNGKLNSKALEEARWFIGSNGNSRDGKNTIIGEADRASDASLDAAGSSDLDEAADEVGFFPGTNLTTLG